MDCLGCRVANGTEPDVNIVFEDSLVACILDFAPFNEGHILVLPKQHVVELEELDPVVADSILRASVKMSKVMKAVFMPDGITVCQSGGVFNDLNHFHVHLIPRYKGDGFEWSESRRQDGAEHRLRDTKQKLLQALSDHSLLKGC